MKKNYCIFIIILLSFQHFYSQTFSKFPPPRVNIGVVEYDGCFVNRLSLDWIADSRHKRFASAYSIQIYDYSKSKWTVVKTINVSNPNTDAYSFRSNLDFFDNYGYDFFNTTSAGVPNLYRMRVQVIDLKFPSDFYDNNSIYITARRSRRGGCDGGGDGPGDTTKPNLNIPRIGITNGNGQLFNPLNNETPILRRNQFFEINFDVKNTGNANSKATDARLFVGSSSSIGGATEFKILSVPARSPNSTSGLFHNQLITNSDNLGALNLDPGKQYYMFIQVDQTNTNDESNESDNIKKFKFTYSASAGNPGDPGGGTCTICPQPIDEQIAQPYLIEIFNFSGQKILSQRVNDGTEEKQIISTLPRGDLYIVKSKNGDRKVSN
ncbi:MAG: CARDB domain-containing protein [Saonia sp.]